MKRFLLVPLALLALCGTAGAKVTLDADSAQTKDLMQGAVISYRLDNSGPSWTTVAEPFGEGATSTDLPLETHGQGYEIRVVKAEFFKTYTYTKHFPSNRTTIHIERPDIEEHWNLSALVLPPLGAATLVLGIGVPVMRRRRREALIALDKASQAEALAKAAEAEAQAATAQAFEMAKIPLPPSYRVPGYRITDLLGEGGMASVYRVLSEAGDAFAMKVPHADCLKDAENLSRFNREIEISRAVQHPGVLRIYDVGTYATDKFPEVPYLVMEIVKGKSFDAILDEQAPLAIPQAARWARTIVDALGAAHAKGIVHRDIKPSNVMLTDKGEIKLMDFGIARAADSTKLTATGTALGTPSYMAPEQFSDSRGVDGRADIYSMGVMLFQMLTGQLPFDSPDVFALIMQHMNDDPPSLRAIRPDIPEGLEALVLRMLAKDPSDRPHSAIEVASQLSAYVTD